MVRAYVVLVELATLVCWLPMVEFEYQHPSSEVIVCPRNDQVVVAVHLAFMGWAVDWPTVVCVECGTSAVVRKLPS
jgi:hypothetical protein